MHNNMTDMSQSNLVVNNEMEFKLLTKDEVKLNRVEDDNIQIEDQQEKESLAMIQLESVMNLKLQSIGPEAAKAKKGKKKKKKKAKTISAVKSLSEQKLTAAEAEGL